MEDFSPIFWIVLVVGGLIYSAVSQARKAAGKDGGGHTHGEAWPSFEPEEAPVSTMQRSEEASSEDTFPDECQSLEEIPEQECTTSEEPQNRAFSKFSGPLEGYKSQDTKLRTLTAQRPSAADSDNDTSKSSDTSGIAVPISDTEEFDLRRAVIETEILKPKFDE